jgi:hypothetical protein
MICAVCTLGCRDAAPYCSGNQRCYIGQGHSIRRSGQSPPDSSEQYCSLESMLRRSRRARRKKRPLWYVQRPSGLKIIWNRNATQPRCFQRIPRPPAGGVQKSVPPEEQKICCAGDTGGSMGRQDSGKKAPVSTHRLHRRVIRFWATSLSHLPPRSPSLATRRNKPGARPGSSPAIARRSVLRNRRAAEMVVHADANDVVVESDFRRRRHSSHTAALKGCRSNVVCEASGGAGCGSQIVVKVFKLCAPIGGKHPLAAGTHGISNTGLRKRPRCQGGRRRIDRIGYGLKDRGVGLGSAD